MKLNIKYVLRTRNNDGMSQNLFPTRKSKISHNPVLDNLKTGYLKVSYGKNVHNDGTFNTKQGLLCALKQWTEPELLKYIEEGTWD